MSNIQLQAYEGNAYFQFANLALNTTIGRYSTAISWQQAPYLESKDEDSWFKSKKGVIGIVVQC